MDAVRAKQILESPNTIEVTCGGQSVWIDSVDVGTQTAQVHTRDASNKSIRVHCNELAEQS